MPAGRERSIEFMPGENKLIKKGRKQPLCCGHDLHTKINPAFVLNGCGPFSKNISAESMKIPRKITELNRDVYFPVQASERTENKSCAARFASSDFSEKVEISDCDIKIHPAQEIFVARKVKQLIVLC